MTLVYLLVSDSDLFSALYSLEDSNLPNNTFFEINLLISPNLNYNSFSQLWFELPILEGFS